MLYNSRARLRKLASGPVQMFVSPRFIRPVSLKGTIANHGRAQMAGCP